MVVCVGPHLELIRLRAADPHAGGAKRELTDLVCTVNMRDNPGKELHSEVSVAQKSNANVRREAQNFVVWRS